MKHICKESEPSAWRVHRATPGATFEAIAELKESLLQEQGYICCYCMSRISAEQMRVEHFRPRRYTESVMAYDNLMAACSGISNQHRHCDTNKADQEISINPTDHRCETIISYSSNGKIRFLEEYRADIEDTLNLNNPILIANRKAALDATLDLLKRANRGFSTGSLEKTLAKFQAKDEGGRYSPFCQVILWWLTKKLKQQ